MKHLVPTAWLVLVACATTIHGRADESSAFLDHNQWMTALHKGLKRVMKDDGMPDLRVLQEQLAAGNCADLELTSPRRKRMRPDRIFRHCKQGTVLVIGMKQGDKPNVWTSSTGTGFVISRDGAIVTNYHVMKKDADEVDVFLVMTHDQRVFPVAEILASNESDDLAILRVEADGLVPLPVARDVGIGEAAYVISHPTRKYFMFTDGVVSGKYALRKGDKTLSRLSITADYAKGSSGGPVLNNRGEVIGVVASTRTIYYNEENGHKTNSQMVLRYCIPSGRLLELIE